MSVQEIKAGLQQLNERERSEVQVFLRELWFAEHPEATEELDAINDRMSAGEKFRWSEVRNQPGQ